MPAAGPVSVLLPVTLCPTRRLLQMPPLQKEAFPGLPGPLFHYGISSGVSSQHLPGPEVTLFVGLLLYLTWCSIHTSELIFVYTEETDAKISEVTGMPKATHYSVAKPGFELRICLASKPSAHFYT